MSVCIHILYTALSHRLGRAKLKKSLRLCFPSATHVPQSTVPKIWTSEISTDLTHFFEIHQILPVTDSFLT